MASDTARAPGSPLAPTLFLAPSLSAAQILTRRLARRRGALAAFWAMRPLDLAERIATATCLARGEKPWGAGHAALSAEQLLQDGPGRRFLGSRMPPGPAARVLARTIEDLRAAGIEPARVRELSRDRSRPLIEEDRLRLSALGEVYEAYERRLARGFFDRTALFREAARLVREGGSRFVDGVDIQLSPDLEPRPDELAFVLALRARARVRRIAEPETALGPSPFAAACDAAGVEAIHWDDTPLGEATRLSPDASPETPRPARVAARIFGGFGATDSPASGHDVEFATAPGESAEVRFVARRILLAASRGVPFDEIALVIPQPEVYAPIVADVLARVGIPYRLHPSLPLSFGRIARSLLLLLRSRGFDRGALMEFLTFAPTSLPAIAGDPDAPHPSVFDALSRDLKVVSGADRFRVALDHFVAEETAGLSRVSPGRRPDAERRIREATAFRRLVDRLEGALRVLEGEATLEAWSQRLKALLAEWIRPDDAVEAEEYATVLEALDDLASLGAVSKPVSFDSVERVLESRFEWKRKPLETRQRGGVHVGSPDALAGGRAQIVFAVGLVEGRFPGVFRPDPFLLDADRRALEVTASRAALVEGSRSAAASDAAARRQRSLFDGDAGGDASSAAEPADAPSWLETTETRARRARRSFARIFAMAEERIVLTYPRADEQTGRERLPSLFLLSAAEAIHGRPIGGADFARLVVEEDESRASAAPDLALDLGSRDLAAFEVHGPPVLPKLEADRVFLRSARDLARARASRRLTAWDGFVGLHPRDGVSLSGLREKLDPIALKAPVSASRLGVFGECGFRYFLQYVLRVEPALEPEERRRLDPLEKGTLFHEVAELFLRSRRDRGLLPVRDTEEERSELRALAEARLDAWVTGSPPRLVLLWRAEKKAFLALLDGWLQRESKPGKPPSIPAHFEVGFGLFDRTGDTREPHRREPVEIRLDDGRALLISGKIDRIDRVAPEDGGGLVLRDYKTGKAPTGPAGSDGAFLKGGRQLQIPFYVLAADALFPGEPVRAAFLDYVNGGRPVPMSPDLARSSAFRGLLVQVLDFIGSGVFVQDPTACTFCDFQAVCGPRNLLEGRRRGKLADPLVRRVFDSKRFS